MFLKMEIIKKIKEESRLDKLIEYLIYQDLELQELIIDKVLDILSTKENFSKEDISLLVYMLSMKELRYLVLEFLYEFPVNEIEPYLIGIYLFDNNYLNRVEACEALFSLNKNFNYLFIKGLKDKNELVRAYSINNMSDNINNSILNKILELEKNDSSMIVKISCRRKLFLLTREEKWLKKIYRNIRSKNYHVAIWAIRSIKEFIDKSILKIDNVKIIILEAYKNEMRGSVKENLKELIDDYIN